MAAKDIVAAFEKEYEMSFFSNRDRARDFTNGWCAAKAMEVQKPSHNKPSAPCCPRLTRCDDGVWRCGILVN